MEETADPECWYEIHEWIQPNNTRTPPGWAPVCIADGAGLQVWREVDKKLALVQFQDVDPKRRFRLVEVSRKTMAEQNPEPRKA